MRNYEVINRRPVARFYYKGTHSHPVRRTVLLINVTQNTISGFELREGSVVRAFNEAPVKTYRRRNIAKFNMCGKRLKNRLRKGIVKVNGVRVGLENTTFSRYSLIDLVRHGA
jgi:argininosuccinate synthase